MNAPRNVRLAVTKAVLWFLVGAGAAIAAVRFALGLGVTTALTDLTPWGLWIGFDVVSGVALAAGGFVIAAAVHVFHLKRYHGVLRPAILTAFLGYTAVVLGLLVDLGRPWNIWRMMVYWNPHSPLFEVGWCVMLYLTVLTLEFAPVVAESLRWSKIYAVLKKVTLPLVVAGIALSTLHQSSLGTLFLINPQRMHPLWYSPLLPVLFFVSAVGLGLATVIVENVVSSWLFRVEPEAHLLPGLTRAAGWALAGYLALRLGDLAWRGKLALALEGSWASALFLTEILIAVVVPLLLFTLPSARRSTRAMGTGAMLVVGGFVLNRATVAGISHVPVTGSRYLPSIPEILVSLGVVAAMALVFLFFVEHLRVWETPPDPADHFRAPMVDPASGVYVRGPWMGVVQRAALACVLGVSAGLVLLELGTANGAEPRPTPVRPPRAVDVLRLPVPGSSEQHRLVLEPAAAGTGTVENALLIDGDRRGRFAIFEHERHQQRLGGAASCVKCHHVNAPLSKGTSCSQCHRDMYRATDTFSHSRHVTALGGNAGCISCHRPGAAKTRAASASCTGCHPDSRVPSRGVAVASAMPQGFAPGYKDAMHTLCIDCHAKYETEHAVAKPVLSRCPNCHRARAADGWDLAVRGGAVASSTVRP